ncbi:MAG: hypothetical protein ACXVRZ_12385 [Gaiellaceae bacterium]
MRSIRRSRTPEPETEQDSDIEYGPGCAFKGDELVWFISPSFIARTKSRSSSERSNATTSKSPSLDGARRVR